MRRTSAGGAFDEIYDDLRRVAAIMLAREHGTQTMQATAVVHEAFVRLNATHALTRFSEDALLAIAARVIRQVLVDGARRRRVRRRSLTDRSAQTKTGAGDASAATSDGLDLDGFDIERLDCALEELRLLAPRAAEVVELRFFGDLPMTKIADILGCARSTVQADWRFARAMLLRKLGEHAPR